MKTFLKATPGYLPLVLNDSGIYTAIAIHVAEGCLMGVISLLQPQIRPNINVVLVAESIFIWIIITAAQKIPRTKNNYVKFVSHKYLIATILVLDGMMFGAFRCYANGWIGAALVVAVLRYIIMAAALSTIQQPVE